MTEFRNHCGEIECPTCHSKTKVAIPVPVVEQGKVNIAKEVFCSNQYCEARLRLNGTFTKKKKEPEGSLKINQFLFNGEEKDQTLYWHTA